jgi:hypothetical protein
VQLPDGNIGEFPDGMSQQDIESVLQKQYPAPQQRSLPAQIGHDVALLGRNIISGAAALPSLAVDAGNKLLGSQKPFGTNQESVEAGLDTLGFPRAENVGQAISGGVASGLGGMASGMGAGQVLKGIPAAASVGKFLTAAPEAQAVSTGLSSGASAAVKEGGGSERAQFIAGIVAGLLPTAAPAARMAALKTLQSMAGPERLAVAKAMKDQGVDLSVAQVTNSPFLKATAAASEATPFSSAGRLGERQAPQMNAAANRVIGQTGDDVVEGIANAKTAAGQSYNKVYGTDFNLDPQFSTESAKILAEAKRTLPTSQQGPLQNMYDDIVEMTGPNGEIHGPAAQNLKKQLDAVANSSDTSLAQYAKDLRTSFTNAIGRFDPARGQQIRDTNRIYHNAKTLEKATAQNSIGGDIGIAKLSNLKNLTQGQGELKDLAKGATMIKQGTVGNSGTAARMNASVMGSLAAAGSFGGTVAAAQAFNRGFNQNQSIINAMVKKSPTFKSLIDRGAPAATVNYMLQQLSPEAREAARNGEEDAQ